MVEELLERFSAVVSDVCACLMGFKVRLDHFEGKINLGLKQLIQAAASTPEELEELKSELSSCKAKLEKHREEANKSHDYFVEVSQKCATQFNRIAELEAKEALDSDESEELSVLKLRFDLVISVDH